MIYWCLYCIRTEAMVNEKTRSLSVWMASPSWCETALWDGPQTSPRSFRRGSTTMPHSSTGPKYALWTQAGGFWRYWTLYAIWGSHNVTRQNWQNIAIALRINDREIFYQTVQLNLQWKWFQTNTTCMGLNNRSKEVNNKLINVSTDEQLIFDLLWMIFRTV